MNPRTLRLRADHLAIPTLAAALSLALAASAAADPKVKWELMRDGTDVGAGPGGVVFALGADWGPGGYNLYALEGGSWTQVKGGAAGGTRIDVGPDGVAWIVQSNARIYRTTRSDWGLGTEHVRGPWAKDIGVGANGAVWIVGTEVVGRGHKIYRRTTDEEWQAVPGSAVRIDVGPDGDPWIVKPGGGIAHWGGAEWVDVPGLARDIAVGADGAVWIVKEDGLAARWGGVEFEPATGAKLANVSVDDQGRPWGVTPANKLVRAVTVEPATPKLPPPGERAPDPAIVSLPIPPKKPEPPAGPSGPSGPGELPPGIPIPPKKPEPPAAPAVEAPASAPVVARLFEHEDFQGRAIELTGDVAQLVGRGFNDAASSIQLVGAGAVTLYEHEGMGGRCVAIVGDVRKLVDTAVGNDTASSVRLGKTCDATSGGSTPTPAPTPTPTPAPTPAPAPAPAPEPTPTLAATLFLDEGFGGRAVPIHRDVPKLVSLGLNDQLSSLKIGGAGPITLWEHEDYQGRCVYVAADVAKMVLTAVGNDLASSIRVGKFCDTPATRDCGSKDDPGCDRVLRGQAPLANDEWATFYKAVKNTPVQHKQATLITTTLANRPLTARQLGLLLDCLIVNHIKLETAAAIAGNVVDPENARAHANKFTVARMRKDYLKLFGG